ncbi:hypothetical protein EZS27_039410 [termite gut metagenome]|uniref:Uncharacterized protein n=1 Tax=termite gut metagenome TaxID=433724 RepID=A0A5J4PHT7_9ZZZZ
MDANLLHSLKIIFDDVYLYSEQGIKKANPISKQKKAHKAINWGVPRWVGLSATILFVRTLTKRIFATIPNAHADFATNCSATPKELYTPSAFIKKKENDNVNGDTFVRSMRDSIRV